MKFLVVESEKADERDKRRQHTGKSSGESYQATLEQIVPGAHVERAKPADPEERIFTPAELAEYDAVFVTGAPLHVYEETPETARQIAFMQAVFRSGTPSFGSCAGLQLAAAAAGGTVRAMPKRIEAAIARRITATDAGRTHPLLAGRPASWDAPAIHTDEVEALPDGAVCLASNGATRVQAAEIRYDNGVFWGVQYHPELAPGEIAIALRSQADSLIEAGLAHDEDEVEQRARLLDAIHDSPGDTAVRWALGIDGEFAEEEGRRRELSNFIAAAPSLRGAEPAQE